MDLQTKIHLITQALDAAGSLTPATELATLDEWDSMGQISIIAMLNKNFKSVLSAEQLATLKTVQDILDRMVEA